MSEKELVYPVRLPGRIRVGMRELSNWFQFGRYAIVGASGYVVSIATFAVLYNLVGLTYWIAAAGAFCLALTNNFLWNRHWTFRARDGHVGFQASRYVLINCVAFLCSLGVLHVLIDIAGVPGVAAQSVAVLAAAPPNYIAHRIWSFRV
ncbi:MAG TPA: GtrA family protein [Solirubrobacteraceae bacterium]|nr:GtrA family protein [Solirubrobacteraceae bacterium]